MSEISIKLTIPSIRRVQTRYQIPGVVRAQGPDRTILGGISWALAAQGVPAFAGEQSWTVPALSRARYWQGTDDQLTLDVLKHGYMVFAVPGDPQLYFIEWENWAAVPAAQDVCKVASVDAIFDLRPRLPQGPALLVAALAALFDTNIGPAQGWIVGDDTVIPETYTTITADQPRGRFATDVPSSGWLDPNFDDTSWTEGVETSAPTLVTSGYTPDVTTLDALVSSLGQVWIGTSDSPPMLIYTAEGTDTGSPLSGNGLDVNIGNSAGVPYLVGTQVWVLNSDLTISRFHLDGSPAGSVLTMSGTPSNQGLIVVADEVWFFLAGSASIVRLKFDGTSAGADITGGGLSIGSGFSGPFLAEIIGSQVWFRMDSTQNSPAQSIVFCRFNFDGSVVGTLTLRAAVASNGSSNGVYAAPFFQVGDQVWILYSDITNAIMRLNLDGTSAGADLTENGMGHSTTSGAHPITMVIFGSEVWVEVPDFPSWCRFNFDGSSAGSPVTISNPDGLSPMFQHVIKDHFWVAFSDSSVFLIAADGTTFAHPSTGLAEFALGQFLFVPLNYYRRKFVPPAQSGKVIDHGTLWAETDTIAALVNLWLNDNVLPLTDLDTGQTISAAYLNDVAENVLAMELASDTVEFRIVVEYRI